MSSEFSHLDRKGIHIQTTDVSAKRVTHRTAIARSTLKVSPELFSLLDENTMRCNAIFTTAKTAGILAAKKTGELIPLCHPLGIENAEITIRLHPPNIIRIESCISLFGKTGVEMEALMAASTAALTVYDMCKSVDKKIRIEQTGLYRKTGGKSGEFINQDMVWSD